MIAGICIGGGLQVALVMRHPYRGARHPLGHPCGAPWSGLSAGRRDVAGAGGGRGQRPRHPDVGAYLRCRGGLRDGSADQAGRAGGTGGPAFANMRPGWPSNAPLTMAAAKATIREGLKDGADRDLKNIADDGLAMFRQRGLSRGRERVHGEAPAALLRPLKHGRQDHFSFTLGAVISAPPDVWSADEAIRSSPPGRIDGSSTSPLLASFR